MDNNSHFEKIFWFVVSSVAMVMIYIFAITFFPIPKENVRFADTALSFLMGTVVGNGIGYFLGGNAIATKKTANIDKSENTNT